MWFDLRGDVRTAFRMLQRNPGTSSLIVATLAVAIGAATVGFAFADFALFRGLPVDDTSRVVSVFASDTHGSNPRARVSAPDLIDYRARTTTLVHLSGMREGRVPLIRNGQSQTLTAGYVTANVFPAMGQYASLGRIFQEGEDLPGAAPVVVLAHHYWRDEMQSRADAIGRTLQIGRTFYTVVGVMNPDIEFGSIAEADVWLPLSLSAEEPRDARNLRFIARLKDDVVFEQAAAEMASIGAALAAEHPLTNGGWTMRLVPIRDITGGQGFWVIVALFLLSMGLLVAIATANVSNLIMVRAASRARELAVRTAMGARNGRLLRQFVVEGFILATLGAAFSLPVAWLGLLGIATLNPEPAFQQIAIDPHELSFVASLALICPLVFSLASARQIRTTDLRGVLAAQGGRGTTATMRGRSALVVAQVALAVVLLTASTLAFKSVRFAFGQPLGMAINRLLIFGLDYNDVIYPNVESARAAAEEIRTALARVPGVTRVSAVNALPVLGDTSMLAITIDGQAAVPGEPSPTAVITGGDANAGQTLGVPLRAGQWWADGMTTGAVITQSAAQRYFGGVERAIGRNVAFQLGQDRHVYQVIGVSDDVANTDRTSAPPPRIWIPMPPSTRRMTFIVEGQEPAALASGVRTVVASIASSVAVENLQTFSDAITRAEASDYVIILTLGGFAIVALLLADERVVRRDVVFSVAAHRRVRNPHGARCAGQRGGRYRRASVRALACCRSACGPGRRRRRRFCDARRAVRHLAGRSRHARRHRGIAGSSVVCRDGTAGVARVTHRSRDCPPRRVDGSDGPFSDRFALLGEGGPARCPEAGPEEEPHASNQSRHSAHFDRVPRGVAACRRGTGSSSWPSRHSSDIVTQGID